MVLVSLMWSVICAVKSIYPFGTKVLSIGDMGEQTIPIYTFLWDVMHGDKSIFFDWNTGLGNNMAGIISHFALISPFNFFFFFVPRDFIELSMFYFFLLKLLGITGSIYFVARRWFPYIRTTVVYAFCMLYVFSPFFVDYYRFPSWLDSIFIFPLIIYFYFELMHEKGKGIGYTICLSLAAVMSFQHTFMLVILLVFMTGGLVISDREKYGKGIVRLLVLSVVGALLSACVWLPGVMQIFTASRFDGNRSIMELFSTVYIFNSNKWMKIINLGLPIGLACCMVKDIRKNKALRWFFYMDIILVLPILLESTNLLWHGGSYQGYTMRFAYMLTFWMIITGLYCYQQSEDKVTLQSISNTWQWIVAGVLSVFVIGVSYYVSNHTISILLIIIVVILSACIGVSVLWVNGAGYGILVLVSTVAISLSMMGNKITPITDMSDSGGLLYYEIYKQEESSSVLDRIKMLSAFVSQNYPLYLQKSAIGNYNASEATAQIKSMTDIGYAKIGYRMSDYGGTVFSDALLGVREAIGTEADNELYTEKVQYGDSIIYLPQYTYEDGILIQQDWDETVIGNGNPFTWQNEMSESVLGIELLTLYETRTDAMDIRIDEKSILYCYVPNTPQPTVIINTITVTDKDTGQQTEKKLHESGWENGIVSLGVYSGQDLQISIDKAENIDTIFLAVLPLNKLEEYQPSYAENFHYTAGGHSMNISLTDASKGDRLFLPIYHDKGWKCYVNDREAETDTFLTGGMVIPLAEGDNVIR
ncbi:MAG: YfhO family protein, partial [Lachnospiraceae bacterium]